MVWALGEWAVRWTFGDPDPDQVDPHLLDVADAPAGPPRGGTGAAYDDPVRLTPPRRCRAWLVFDPSDATVCTQDPGYEVDIWVRADAMELERVWMGRTTLDDAVAAGSVAVEGLPRGLRTFKTWFA